MRALLSSFKLCTGTDGVSTTGVQAEKVATASDNGSNETYIYI